MDDWITDNPIPLGRWIAGFMEWFNGFAAGFLNAVSDVLEDGIDAMIDGLLWVHPFVLIGLFALVALVVHRDWKLPLAIILALLLVVNLDYWEETIQTLSLVLIATSLCMAVGIPVGIVAAHKPVVYTVLRPILDLMQTIPTFVYLIPTLILFGLGVVPGIISTVIFAIPAPIRLTYLGISSVPKPLIEAGQAFGADRHQLLWKVELPHALPTIMAGLTQCIMLSLSMVVIAALVGADGLGKPVVRALNTVNIAQGFEAGLAIVILAILLDRFFKQPTRPGGDK
ncbi:MAG: choline ABC transporter permease subunit [Rhodospirillaceae bacterium]|nr:choline ABC transporter permease subunit [Rhodospirillaceae bacterium]